VQHQSTLVTKSTQESWRYKDGKKLWEDNGKGATGSALIKCNSLPVVAVTAKVKLNLKTSA
jgi:hypothetical protein